LEFVSYTIILTDQKIERIDEIQHLLKNVEDLGFKTIHIDESL